MPAVALSAGIHLVAQCLGSSAVWLALRMMGHPINISTALAIESLGSTIAADGFMAPGAIGVQKSGYICAALGLPVKLELAMSLVKHARQILLGLPALASCTLGLPRTGAAEEQVRRPRGKNDRVSRSISLIVGCGPPKRSNQSRLLKIAHAAAQHTAADRPTP